MIGHTFDFCSRYASDPRQPRGSHSSQGSVGEEITRQKTSYTESAPSDPDQRSGSRTSSLEPNDTPAQGSSTAPRQPTKSKGNSKSFMFFPLFLPGVHVLLYYFTLSNAKRFYLSGGEC